MALIKCPDCEKMISERVENCPFCGCPAKFFSLNEPEEKKEEIKEKKQPEMVVFRLWENCEIKYEKGNEEFAELFGLFLKAADDAYNGLKREYKAAGNIVEALKIIPDKAIKFIEGAMNESTRYLYSIGKNITVEQFYNNHYRNYNLDYEDYVKGVFDSYADIMGMKEQMNAQRQMEIASRGRWQGGGFGLKGAVKGAVTASVLNAGSDFLHSFGDSARENRDNNIISGKLQTLYKNQSTENALCYSVKTIVMNIFFALVSDLCQCGFNKTIVLDRSEAEQIYKATVAYENDVMKIAEKMVSCITKYPGEIRYYEPIYPLLMDGENDFGNFLKYWNIEYLFAEYEKEHQKTLGFKKYAKESGLEDFDYSDVTVENAIKLRKLVYAYQDKYEGELPTQGGLQKKIKEYFGKISRTGVVEDVRICDWMPLEYSLEEYLKEIKRDEKYFDSSITKSIWTLGDADFEDENFEDEQDRIDIWEGAYPSKKTKRMLREGEAKILFYYDSSMMRKGGKGFAITTQYIWDLKTQTKLPLKEVSDITVVKIKDRFGLQIIGKENTITVVDSNYKFDEDERGLKCFANQLRVMLVRYFGNTNLWDSNMQVSKPIEAVKQEKSLLSEEKIQTAAEEKEDVKLSSYSELDIEIIKNFAESEAISAIRYYREKTGQDLGTSKAYIEHLWKRTQGLRKKIIESSAVNSLDDSVSSEISDGKTEVIEEIECPGCMKKIKLTAKFCNFCGAKNEEKIKCEGCGSLILKTAKFCNFCGHLNKYREER